MCNSQQPFSFDKVHNQPILIHLMLTIKLIILTILVRRWYFKDDNIIDMINSTTINIMDLVSADIARVI